MRRTRSSTRGTARSDRPSRRIHAESPAKLPTATSCPDCGATYRRGRWTWEKAEGAARERRCPACEAVATRSPAGVVHVRGAYAAAHRKELVALVGHIAERECAEHPLKRILGISDEPGGFVVETTDGKLAQAMGRALAKAHAGKVAFPRATADEGSLVRVRWTRD
jgi:hypothetical protein